MKSIYTEIEKQNIVNKRLLKGSNISKVARKYNVSRRTLYYWIDDYKEIDKITYKEYKKLKNDYKRIRTELEILQSLNCLPSSNNTTKMKEISRFYGVYSVKTMCRLLNVNHSTFYNYYLRRVKETKTMKRDAFLKPIIKEIFIESGERFGKRKVVATLKQKGIIVSHRKVSSLMKEMNLIPFLPKRKMFYPNINKNINLKNHLNQNFKATKVNEKWLSDVTYIWMDNSFVYLCVIIDLYSRKVISYKVSYKNNSKLVIETLKEAYIKRKFPSGVIFHSDRGSKYTANIVTKLRKEFKFKNSFSDTGNPYDNAPIESFFSHLKKEEVNRNVYRSFKELKESIDSYINFYNNNRPHISLGNLTPTQYEKNRTS